MRKLDHGRSIFFFAPPEVDRGIRVVNNNGVAEAIHVSDILVWAMVETCSDGKSVRGPQDCLFTNP
jgi:hypothetical protein